MLCAVAGLLAVLGCAGGAHYSPQVKSALVGGDFTAALGYVESIDRRSSELLYFYERGLVLHYQDDYVGSNEAFENAELLFDELYTKSVTRELSALLTSDRVTKYRGDPFETVFTNYYKILNYLYLGDREAALVECRRISQKLQVIADAEEESYVNDPFLQYLTAMLYQESGDRGAADVSYRVAMSAYEELATSQGVEIPSQLYCDAAHNARLLGDRSAAREYEDKLNGECARTDGDVATVNILLETGYVAHKVEENIVIPIYEDDDDGDRDRYFVTLANRYNQPYRSNVKIHYLLRVALPVLAPTNNPYAGATVRAGGVQVGRAHGYVSNLDAVAAASYDQSQGRVVLKSIARAFLKYAIKRKADKESPALGVLANVFAIATESADTRSWSTLPSHIIMVRAHVPAGVHDLNVTLLDPFGDPAGEITIPQVEVRAGETLFMNRRVY